MNKIVSYVRTNPNEISSNQLNIINNYCKANNIKLSKEYIDNGYTALDYNRQYLKMLLYDVSQGLIDTIIITNLLVIGKDLSKTIYYLNFFKEHNIKLISIIDNFINDDLDDAYYKFNEIKELLYGKTTNNK